MADHLYVDTDASSGGNGSSRNHTGTGRAYNKLNNCLGGLSGTTLTDDLYIWCAGSSADTTAAVPPSFTATGYNIYIQGDTGADHTSEGGDDGTAFDNDGEYTGDTFWSTAHYRLDTSTPNISLQLVNNTGGTWRINRMQIRNTKASWSAVCIENIRNAYITNCRIRGTKDNAQNPYAILNNATTSLCKLFEVSGNIISEIGQGIVCAHYSHSGHTMSVYNNVIANIEQWGITFNAAFTVGSAVTFEVHNNVVFNNDVGTSNSDYDNLNRSGPTINVSHNAGESSTAPTGHDSNWIQLSGTLTTDMVDPENATVASQDYKPVSGGQLDGLGTTGGPANDIQGTAHNSPADLGAFALAAAAAYTAELTAASYAYTANALSRANDVVNAMTTATYAYTANALAHTVGYLAELTTDTYAYTANAVTRLSAQLVEMTTDTYAYTANALTRINAYTAELTTDAYAYTANALTHTVGFLAELTTASYAYTANAVTRLNAQLLELTAASYAYTANALTHITGFIAGMTADAYTYTANAVTRTNAYIAALSAATITYTSNALSYAAASVRTLLTDAKRGLTRALTRGLFVDDTSE